MILSPLEQFSIISLIAIHFADVYLSFTSCSLFFLLTTGCVVLLFQMVTQSGGSPLAVRWQSLVKDFYKLVPGLPFLLGFSTFCLVYGALLHGSYCEENTINSIHTMETDRALEPVKVLCQAYAAVSLRMLLLHYSYSLLSFSLIYMKALTVVIFLSLIWSYLPVSWTGKLTGDWGNIFQRFLIDFRFIQAHLMVLFVTLLAVFFLGNNYHYFDAVFIVYVTLPLYALYCRRVDPKYALTFFTIKLSSLVQGFFLLLFAYCILWGGVACVNILLEVAAWQMENIEIMQRFPPAAPHGGNGLVSSPLESIRELFYPPLMLWRGTR